MKKLFSETFARHQHRLLHVTLFITL